MQLEGATALEKELYAVCLLWEEQPASEFQTRVSAALSQASGELQRLRLAAAPEPSVRCKFSCGYKDPRTGQIFLSPVYAGSDENKRFFLATPGGDIRFYAITEAVAGFFQPGYEYYVDFTKAAEPKDSENARRRASDRAHIH